MGDEGRDQFREIDLLPVDRRDHRPQDDGKIARLPGALEQAADELGLDEHAEPCPIGGFGRRDGRGRLSVERHCVTSKARIERAGECRTASNTLGKLTKSLYLLRELNQDKARHGRVRNATAFGSSGRGRRIPAQGGRGLSHEPRPQGRGRGERRADAPPGVARDARSRPARHPAARAGRRLRPRPLAAREQRAGRDHHADGGRRSGRQGARARKRCRRLRRQAVRAARAGGALQERAAPLGQQDRRRRASNGCAWAATCSISPRARCTTTPAGTSR